MFYSTRSYKTKPWLITLISLLILLLFSTVWLLIGQQDLLNVDWLVAKRGTLWKGEITANNYDRLLAKYPQIAGIELNKFYNIINLSNTICSINVLYVILGCVFTSILVPLVLKITKVANWDLFTFSLSMTISCVVWFFVDLIPHWGNNEMVRSICLIGIMLCVSFSTFLFFNWIINSFLANSPNAFDIVMDISNQDADIKESDKTIKDMMKSDKKEEYVEIEE